jgi:hypothetical protein
MNVYLYWFCKSGEFDVRSKDTPQEVKGKSYQRHSPPNFQATEYTEEKEKNLLKLCALCGKYQNAMVYKRQCSSRWAYG